MSILLTMIILSGNALSKITDFLWNIVAKLKDPLFIIIVIAVLLAIVIAVGVIRNLVTKTPEEEFFESLKDEEDNSK